MTDSTGAVLPGVTVTVEHTGTHDTRVAPTSASGDYTFNLLPIGAFTVRIEWSGCSTQTTRVERWAGLRQIGAF